MPLLSKHDDNGEGISPGPYTLDSIEALHAEDSDGLEDPVLARNADSAS